MIDMSPLLLGLIGLALLLILLFLGVQIAIALLLVGILGIFVSTGSFASSLGVLKTAPYTTVATISLSVLPLFILMGYFTLHGGISQRAFKTAHKWMGKLPGGLSIATTWACVAFGAVSGASIAAATVFTKISLPEMKKAGYDNKFALGGIAASSLIAMLIPPSLFFIIYAIIARESVGKMLIAGIFPGIILALTLTLSIILTATINPSLAPKSAISVPIKEKLTSLTGLWQVAVLILIIMGGIYSGVFTPTEAAAIGVIAASVLALAHKGLSWTKLKNSLIETLDVTAMIFFILIGATVFSRFLVVSGFTNSVAGSIIDMNLSLYAFISILMVLYLIIGGFMDQIPAMAITLPIFLPVIKAFGMSPIWFGVLVVASLNIGAITPPYGIVVFATKAAAGPDVTVEEVFRGTYLYYVGHIACLVILVIFPSISLFLPNTMMS